MNIDEKLLQRYIDGTISDDEVPQVIAWLDESPDHVREFQALHKVYQISLMNAREVGGVVPEKEKDKRIAMRSVFREVMKVAAIFLVFLGGSYLVDRFRAPEVVEEIAQYQSLFVPAGQRAELTLPDQTKVWVNSRSTLRYPVKFGKDGRKVELDGEAFFEVSKDAENPFIVETGAIDVRVLGTEFNLKAYKDKSFAEVALLQGKVEVSSDSHPQPVYMAPGESIYYQDGEFERGRIQDMNYFRWREGLICFEDESVGEIFRKLELYYDIKIEMGNKALLKESYSGKFRTKDGIEQVLKVLQIEHRFTYTIDKENNLLVIK